MSNYWRWFRVYIFHISSSKLLVQAALCCFILYVGNINIQSTRLNETIAVHCSIDIRKTQVIQSPTMYSDGDVKKKKHKFLQIIMSSYFIKEFGLSPFFFISEYAFCRRRCIRRSCRPTQGTFSSHISRSESQGIHLVVSCIDCQISYNIALWKGILLQRPYSVSNTCELTRNG